MIDYLDNLLRQLFVKEIDEISQGDTQVRFQPPDEDWRTFVANLTVAGQPANALNVYLVDLRENRKLRSNQRTRSLNGGMVHAEQAPRRVDCHYLISAWSPAPNTVAVEPAIDEHLLLYKTIAALTRNDSMVPRRIYDPDPLPPGFPSAIADAELPVALLPVEGFPKYAEFWGTMGNNHRWKPAVWMIVTVPVLYELEFAGAMVTTRIAEFRIGRVPETAETWIQIGGHVIDTTPAQPTPVNDAWVRLTTPGGEPLQITRTNELGRFTFAGLKAGPFRLRTQAPGHPEVVRDVDVPSPTGEYDLQF
jgi:Pvc16 N-terminal domain/Carboxypeptidase regulatory-like domain